MSTALRNDPRADDITPPATVAEDSAVTAGMTHCARCGAYWGGLKTAHCAACHQTFTTVANFDHHRDGSHSRNTRHCVPPLTVGLIHAGRAYPCWSQPERTEAVDQLANTRPADSRRTETNSGDHQADLDGRVGTGPHALDVWEVTPT